MLERLGLDRPLVLVREPWCEQVHRALGDGVLCRPFRSAGELFAALGQVSQDGERALLVLPGEVLTHDGLLEDLLASVPTAVLGGPLDGGPALRTTETGRVTSAGSVRHQVTGANAALLATLRVAVGDRPRFAEVTAELAEATSAWSDADTDAVRLLTVGLVRRGVTVGSVPAGKYVWAAPSSLDELRAAEASLDRADVERARLDRVVKPWDGFYATFVVSPVSKPLVRWAADHGLRPNHLTAASLVVGLLSAMCFGFGSRPLLVAGAVLLQVSFVLDCADGQLARYVRSFSGVGAWMDATSDRVKEFAVYAGLAVGAATAGDDVWTLAAAALALQTFRHMVDLGFAATRRDMAAPQLPLDQVDDVPAAANRPEGLRRSLAARAVGALRAIDRRPGVIWAKRVVILPIGERWALISVTAALFTPRVTFVALLVLAGLATLYMTTGRVLRTVGR